MTRFPRLHETLCEQDHFNAAIVAVAVALGAVKLVMCLIVLAS